MRTGDILLFTDSAWLENNAEPHVRSQYHCARWLARLLSRLPCSAAAVFTSAYQIDDVEDDQRCTPRSSQRAVLPQEWLDWQHAALIVCLSEDSTAAPEKSKPCVFVPNADGNFVLRTLREFVTRCAGRSRTFFAIRHLIINQEAELHGAHAVDSTNTRLVPIRRAHLRDKIVDCHKQMFHDAACTPDPRMMYKCSIRVLTSHQAGNVALNAAAANAKADSEVKRDLLTLMRSSISFATLYTLYAAQVVRIEPRVIDAAQLLQQDERVLKHHLANDYHFTDERLFIVHE